MNSVRHTTSFEIAAPIGELFPLFSPEGEKAWVPGWDYENVMGTAALSEDYVFLTKTHDHAAAKAIWLVKRFEPEQHLIELYKVEPDEKVGLVIVKCVALADGSTKVEVTYQYTALSGSGREFIAGFDETAYQEFVGEWQTLLEKYFVSLDR